MYKFSHGYCLALCVVPDDCIASAPIGSCAENCIVPPDGPADAPKRCTYVTCGAKCCKYTPGNIGGNICAASCGANQICVSPDPAGTGAGICDSQNYIAVCDAGDADFCQCTITALLDENSQATGDDRANICCAERSTAGLSDIPQCLDGTYVG